MKLIAYQKSVIKRNKGIVQTQLTREDRTQVKKLCGLLKTHDDYPDIGNIGPHFTHYDKNLGTLFIIDIGRAHD